MRDKVIQWRVAVSGKNCLQKEEKVERKWVSASDNLTGTFPLINFVTMLMHEIIDYSCFYGSHLL